MKRATLFLYWVCGLSTVFGLLVRTWHISQPNKVVFDEVYFPVMANNMLHGILTFDAHPPLGKMFMAIGIWIFGYNSFGDRIVILLFSLALLALFYFLGRRYFAKEKDGGKLAGILFATFGLLECMLIVYSRLGLMENMMLFFIFVTFFVSLKVKRWWGYIGLGVLIGACVAIKWLALGVVLPVAFIAWRRGDLLKLIAVLPISALVYTAVVLAGGKIGGETDLWAYFVWWHQNVWAYQINLKATHPWSSVWYTWPFMTRPLLMLRDTLPDGRLQVINAIGNPLLWYSSTVAVVVSIGNLIREKFVLKKPILDHPTVPLLLGWFGFWAAWIPVHRVLFIYHYLPSYIFALMMVVYWTLKIWKKQPWVVVGFIFAALLLAIFYTPILIGLPVTLQFLNLHVWFPSWI